ncbi:MAG: MBL fold metallo-hydrolase RNA specificity domain-containing protein [Pirellulales bacterium]
MLRLTFHGAAETVTGSKYLLEEGDARVLIDCGLFQGLKELRLKNWDKLTFDARALPAVVLTHAHIDHTGYLPALVKQGFSGPIYCTPATAELTELLLLDSAKNQEEDADYANRKGYSKHKPALPLYSNADASRAVRLLRSTPREEWFCPVEPFWFRYHQVGHLLGAGMLEVEVRTGPRPMRIMFSGDVGRYNAPIYRDPHPPVQCDYLICESTYGDRDHPDVSVLDELCEAVKGAIRRGGVMLMASFAVGRTQQLVYLLQTLIHQNRIPEIPIFVDSPMAVNATAIYAEFLGDTGLSRDDLLSPSSALGGRNVHLARTAAESKRINGLAGPAVIISSSGMMVGGRILHHLKQRLDDPANTVVIGGYMAAGSRGRSLAEGARKLRMHGQDIPVRCAVVTMSSLSGHAGRSELLRWLAPLESPKRVFLTHGEIKSANSLAEELRTTRGWDVVVPKLYESVELE